MTGDDTRSPISKSAGPVSCPLRVTCTQARLSYLKRKLRRRYEDFRQKCVRGLSKMHWISTNDLRMSLLPLSNLAHNLEIGLFNLVGADPMWYSKVLVHQTIMTPPIASSIMLRELSLPCWELHAAVGPSWMGDESVMSSFGINRSLAHWQEQDIADL